MLYFCKKITSSPTYFLSISQIHHLLDVTLCLRRVFGAHYPLRHWLPLTVRLSLTRQMNLDSSKRKVEQISFRKYSSCDVWHVIDINSIYPRHVKTCLMSIATNKGADQPACAVWTASKFCFFASRISTDVKASLIMLKLECQWCSLFLWLRRLVWILPRRPRNPLDAFSHGMAQFHVDYIEERAD